MEENERLRASLRTRDVSSARSAPPAAFELPSAAAVVLPSQPVFSTQASPSDQLRLITTPQPLSAPSTPRQSSMEDLDYTPDMGSRFFVEQIQGLRAARRAERLEFQHDVESHKLKLLEAVRAKEELQVQVKKQEKKVGVPV